MKHSVLIGLSLVVLSACTGNSQQWLGADPSAGPTHVTGSAENTTNAFDGKYRDISVQNNSKNNTLPIMGGSATLKCQTRVEQLSGPMCCQVIDIIGAGERDRQYVVPRTIRFLALSW